MGVPKRKPSHSRQRMRRAYNSNLTLPQLSTCPQCAAPYVPHRVCPACGFYNGAWRTGSSALFCLCEWLWM